MSHGCLRMRVNHAQPPAIQVDNVFLLEKQSTSANMMQRGMSMMPSGLQQPYAHEQRANLL